MYAFEVGLDWDPPLGAIVDVLDNDAVGEADRWRLTTIRAVFLVARGEIGQQELDELAVVATEPQTRGLLMHAQAVSALVGHRLQDAIQLAEDALAQWHNYTAFLLPMAFLAAVMKHDTQSAERIAREMADYPIGGTLELGLRAWMDGSVTAMNGRADEGIGLIRSGIERLQGAEAHWSAAVSILSTAYLLPGRPEVEGWVPTARETFERLRARPFIALLDERSNQASSQAAGQGQRATASERETTTV